MIWMFFLGILLGVIAAVLSRRYAKNMERSQHGLLFLWVLLACAVPIIGFIGGWVMVYVFRKRQDGTFMEDYSTYIHNKVYNFESLREMLKQDRHLLSAEGQTSENSWMIKSLLLNMSNEKNTHQEKIIKKGLSHPDQEAVHYAATITNVLQDRLLNQLQKLKIEKSPELPNSYEVLLESYQEYLSSDLLSSALREKTEKEYEMFLKEASGLFPEHDSFTVALADFLLESNPEESDKLYERIYEKDPRSSKLMWGKLRISYQKGEWNQVFRLAALLMEQPDLRFFSEQQQETIRFLGGKAE
ncbi:hypothetical protein ACQCVE_07355 [Metabacillus sp. 113a]|uniref:hypothetical protein n=1 Tax=Metabacillus sp. 113a TaxID=3404706 RepID=UPI003CF19188